MRKFDYSNEIANIVKQFLDEDDWRYTFDENIGIFDFNLRMESKIQKISYLMHVDNDEIVCYGVCPISADCEDPEMMAEMAEFICSVNYGHRNGCFELDFRDGEIRFKSFIDCDNLMPSTAVIKNSIYCTAAMFDRYGPGMLEIIFAGCTAKDAIAKCKKSVEDLLRTMRGRANDEDMDGADL